MAEAAPGQLRWRCRRGMKELDQLLLGYLERRYPHAPQAERRCFAEILELPDPQLWAYISGRQQPADPLSRNVLERIVTVHA